MESFNFKKKIRDKLAKNSPTPIPAELLWENISSDILAGLEQEKKHRRMRSRKWILLGSIFLFTCLLAIHSYWSNHSLKSSTLANFPISINSIDYNCRGFTGADTTYQSIQKSGITTQAVSLANHTSSMASEHLKHQKNQRQKKLYIRDSKNPSTPALDQTSSERPMLEEVKSIPPAFLHLPEKSPHLHSTVPIRPISPESNWSLLLFVGPNAYGSNYNFSNGIQDHENNLVGWSASLRMQINLDERWYYQTGIQFDQLSTRFQKQFTEEIQIYAPGTIKEIIINPISGDSSFVTTDTIVGIRNTLIQNNNTVEKWSIPFIVGYQIGKGALNIGLQAGLSVGWLYNETGYTAFGDGEIIQLSQEGVYTSGLLMSTMLESQIEYRFTKDWSLMANAGLQQSLSNWLKLNTAPVSQRPTIFRAGLGIKRDF